MTKMEEGGRQAWSRQRDQHATDFERQRPATPLQATAVAAWIVGIVLQAAGVLFAAGRLESGPVPGWLLCVAALTADLALVLWGASLWRRAGERKTRVAGTASAHGEGTVRVALSSAAFIPMALFFLAARKAGGRTRAVACTCALASAALVVVLVVALGPVS